jgi:hypothetical protein
VNEPKFVGKEWKQGHLLSWSMGQTYQDVLIMQAKQIGKHCNTCKNMNCVTTLMKICGNPQCGQFIYDPNNTTLTTEQQSAIDYDNYTCPQCKQEHYVDEVIECQYCTPQGLTPQRCGIFDVDLQVQAVGNPGSQTFLQILSTSGPRPLQVQDAKVLESIKPIDLLRKFAPTSIERQRQTWNIQVRAAAPAVAQQPGQPPMPTPPGMQPPQAAPVQPPVPTGVVGAPQAPMQAQLPQQPMMQPPVQQPMPPVQGQGIPVPPQPQPQPQPAPAMPAVPYSNTPNTGE